MKVGVSNFRNAWESMGDEFEHVDEYGLGPRENLAEAVIAVINLLGMQPCEVSLSLCDYTMKLITENLTIYKKNKNGPEPVELRNQAIAGEVKVPFYWSVNAGILISCHKFILFLKIADHLSEVNHTECWYSDIIS